MKIEEKEFQNSTNKTEISEFKDKVYPLLTSSKIVVDNYYKSGNEILFATAPINILLDDT